jgi:uncharacterized membrane protein
MRIIYMIGFFLVSMFGSMDAARADVTLCNYSGGLLQFAVAHPVTTPYTTNFIGGWVQLQSGNCITPVVGTLSVSFPFYFLALDANAEIYRPQGVERGYNFCITTDPFERRGSWQKLQNSCPTNWFQADFNGVEIPANTNKTLNYY